MIRVLIITAALIASPALANHVPGHTVTTPVAPKKATSFQGWKPPLEIQNKAGTAVVPAPVKK
jgi:hypothetical protein